MLCVVCVVRVVCAWCVVRVACVVCVVCVCVCVLCVLCVLCVSFPERARLVALDSSGLRGDHFHFLGLGISGWGIWVSMGVGLWG